MASRPWISFAGVAVLLLGWPFLALAEEGQAEPSSPEVRLIAVGDVHGDLSAARRALSLAGVLSEEDRWVGGQTFVVQVGDQLDRGDDEVEILALFERLHQEAREAGGAFHALLGNHETMNVAMDFRYVTDGGWKAFADFPTEGADVGSYPVEQQGRAAAFQPGGHYARLLAERELILEAHDTVFVHGGVLMEHVEKGLPRMRERVREWLRGERPRPAAVRGGGPLWTRRYSHDVEEGGCAELRRVLDALEAKRMVVAHTVQDEGINPACDGLVWRVDVGLAAHYGGETEVLEIIGDEVRVLRSRTED